MKLEGGKQAELTPPNRHTTIFLVLSGEVTVNNGEGKAGEGDLAIFTRSGETIVSWEQAKARNCSLWTVSPLPSRLPDMVRLS